MLQGVLRLKNRRAWGLAIGAIAAVSGLTVYGVATFNQAREEAESSAEVLPPVGIAALGRLEPATEVIQVAAPMALDGDRLLELQVGEGDRVEAGQVIAVLDSRNRLQDEVQQAQERVRAAQARLAQVQAGAQTGELQAQRANISRLQAEIEGSRSVQAATLARLEAEVQTAEREYQRFEQLYQQGAVSASTLDGYRLTATTAQAQLSEARESANRTLTTLQAQLREATATLDRIAEVRPVDVQVAQAEVEGAIAALQQAQTNLEQANIRAPIAGQVLKVHARPGEKLTDSGIADLGQTDEMAVVAEVYQSDVGRVTPGQAAVVTGQAFGGELQGVVSQVGLQIDRQNVFSNQPGENLDRRVVEVRIALTPEASRTVANLTNLQVQVVIQPETSAPQSITDVRYRTTQPAAQ
ncbi:HlyD family efflux transporter periplasmic adaptor subunit [Pseudanabaena sp. FACHB-2040]|uniref:HlyD family efflux transporter periplasmic adaptor subunit n=1 Tax=Pseudanabaena sp. FACHB-2040 TaxID=2692859 RepID=UPI00168570E1|nr:HlyD family efflux transporter periplasmic adaptor subunit [Pseudanabaena sp. FACHB-2040]MBD2260453.1 HlyD family efflux transporter periplasmic adaptor subunit [Pseudanabaena sp. FACHB-2040]